MTYECLILVYDWSVVGKLDVLRICEKVFEELAVVDTAKNTKLLDINSLHVATLMVYK